MISSDPPPAATREQAQTDATNEYATTSRAYLARAAEKLAEHSRRSLFYAAFELRCGIERRVHDYVDALKHISERKKRGWKIIGKAKELEKAFQSGDKIIELAILDEKSGELWFNLYYTPVSKRLLAAGEKLGDFLHARRDPLDDFDPWWKTSREFLETTLSDLALANRGTILGPPMRSPSGEMNLTLYFVNDSNIARKFKRCGFPTAGAEFKMAAQYFDILPEHAAVDLNPLPSTFS